MPTILNIARASGVIVGIFRHHTDGSRWGWGSLGRKVSKRLLWTNDYEAIHYTAPQEYRAIYPRCHNPVGNRFYNPSKVSNHWRRNGVKSVGAKKFQLRPSARYFLNIFCKNHSLLENYRCVPLYMHTPSMPRDNTMTKNIQSQCAGAKTT